MSRFRPGKTRKVPVLNTAALPDLIFTLLFFFMIVTHMRPVPVLLDFEIPTATELQNLDDKSHLIYIMVGEKKDLKNDTSNQTIQLNSSYTSLEELPNALELIKNEIPLEEQSRITIILKIDKETSMGMVNDIRQVLRDLELLMVYYSAEKAIAMQ